MANIRFFLQNSSEYSSGFDDDYDVLGWVTEIGAGYEPAINTTFNDPHGSVMQVTATTLQGAYHYFDVEPGAKYVTEMEYRSSATVKFILNDATNAAILTTIRCAPSTPHWSNFYHEEILPATCTQYQILIRSTSATQTIYIDNAVVQGNAILQDPSIGQTPYSYTDNSQRHVMQDGSVRIDKTSRRINIQLNFPYLTHNQFTRLQDFVNDNGETWFDDQAVPNSIDVGYVYNEAIDDYSTTLYNKAYYASSQTLTASATIFEVSEFSTASYTAIAVDNTSRAMTAAGAATDYVFHKFSIPLTEISSIDEVQSLDVIYKGDSNDDYQGSGEGVKLYLWDGYKYMEVDSAYSSEKSTLNFNTSKPSLAQRFIYTESSTLYIKALARTAYAYHLPAVNLYLRSYYFRSAVNENLDTTIALKDKAILTDGDVVEVKNITRDSVLTLGTHYRIGEDRQSVVLTASPTPGDKIQVEYAKYWYVVPTQIFSENRISAVSATAPERSVSVGLEGITTL